MAVTEYSELTVRQYGSNYEAYLPQGIKVLWLRMPSDGQFIKDASVLEVICKILALRWGIIKRKQNNKGGSKSAISVNYFGLVFRQVDVSGYQIFLPNGDLIACVLFPPDYQYCADSLGLSYVCRAIAMRYGIIEK